MPTWSFHWDRIPHLEILENKAPTTILSAHSGCSSRPSHDTRTEVSDSWGSSNRSDRNDSILNYYCVTLRRCVSMWLSNYFKLIICNDYKMTCSRTGGPMIWGFRPQAEQKLKLVPTEQQRKVTPTRAVFSFILWKVSRLGDDEIPQSTTRSLFGWERLMKQPGMRF